MSLTDTYLRRLDKHGHVFSFSKKGTHNKHLYEVERFFVPCQGSRSQERTHAGAGEKL